MMFNVLESGSYRVGTVGTTLKHALTPPDWFILKGLGVQDSSEVEEFECCIRIIRWHDGSTVELHGKSVQVALGPAKSVRVPYEPDPRD